MNVPIYKQALGADFVKLQRDDGLTGTKQLNAPSNKRNGTLDELVFLRKL